MEKSRLKVFVFSFIPGAGEMYLNMMKKGIFLMASFFAVSFISSTINSGILPFLMPVIWFYSFFETHNMKHFSLDYRIECDNNFANNLDSQFLKDKLNSGNKSKYIGYALVLFGVFYILKMLRLSIYSVIDLINPAIADFIYDIISGSTDFLIALILIVLGIKLIKNGKKDKDSDYIEFKGDDSGRWFYGRR